MKKALTYLFYGGYNTVFFSKEITIPRPSNIIVTSFFLVALTEETILYIPAIVLLALSVFLGFCLNRLFFPTFKDMTLQQKWQTIKKIDVFTWIADNYDRKEVKRLKSDPEMIEYDRIQKTSKFRHIWAILYLIILTPIVIYFYTK